MGLTDCRFPTLWQWWPTTSSTSTGGLSLVLIRATVIAAGPSRTLWLMSVRSLCGNNSQPMQYVTGILNIPSSSQVSDWPDRLSPNPLFLGFGIAANAVALYLKWRCWLAMHDFTARRFEPISNTYPSLAGVLEECTILCTVLILKPPGYSGLQIAIRAMMSPPR